MPTGGSARTAMVETTPAEREAFVLDDAEILELGRWAVTIERHYGRPMDMEWAKDGETGDLYHRPGAAGDRPGARQTAHAARATA